MHKILLYGFFLILTLLEIQVQLTEAAKPSAADFQKKLTKKVEKIPKSQLQSSKVKAAKRMEKNLLKLVEVLGKKNSGVPKNVQRDARTISNAIKKGQLRGPATKSLPFVLQDPSVSFESKNGLDKSGITTYQSLIGHLGQRASVNLQSPLSGIGEFLKVSLNGLNNTTSRLLNGVPTALQGVVGTLVGNLGIVGDTVGASVDNIGPVLGGLLGNTVG